MSVIVPVYNDSQRLKDCLQALSRQTYPSGRYEVVVVDNASDDDVAGVVRAFAGVLLAFERTRGPGAARNRGLALSRGEVIAFTDSDCLPAPDWVEQGVRSLLATSRCGLIGGRIERFFQIPGRPMVAELVDLLYLQQKKHIRRHFAATANVFTFRKIFRKVGGFNETFDMSAYEDREWCARVHARGYRVEYAPDAVVHHPTRRTLSELCRKVIVLRVGKYRYNELTSQKPRPRRMRALLSDAAGLVWWPPLQLRVRELRSLEPQMGIWRTAAIWFVIICMHYVDTFTQLRLRWTRGRWRPERGSCR